MIQKKPGRKVKRKKNKKINEQIDDDFIRRIGSMAFEPAKQQAQHHISTGWAHLSKWTAK
jgi:hypothetical protein